MVDNSDDQDYRIIDTVKYAMPAVVPASKTKPGFLIDLTSQRAGQNRSERLVKTEVIVSSDLQSETPDAIGEDVIKIGVSVFAEIKPHRRAQ